MGDLTPFHLAVSTDDLDDLRQRLARTRWPDREVVDDWSQGVPLSYMEAIGEFWATDYDWARLEAEINRYEQFRYVGQGPAIHLLHVPSAEPGAMPLVLTHGWPGSIVEFLDVIGPLHDPVAHGGDAADAFHLVIPAIPGYGFSDKPTEAGWTVERIADLWAEMMSALGYERFGAQGGDWGSSITTRLALQHPHRLIGIHLNMVSGAPDEADGELTATEQAALADVEEHRRWGTGYSKQQSTRPQTLGYGLVDSPVGQAAWILEKFWAWVDHDGNPEDVIRRERLLDNVMLYWLTGAGASSARLYWESFRSFAAGPVTVPAGLSIFPREIYRPSRRWAERYYTDIVHWNELDRGGHFAALEQPALFVDEVRASFRTLRPGT